MSGLNSLCNHNLQLHCRRNGLGLPSLLVGVRTRIEILAINALELCHPRAATATIGKEMVENVTGSIGIANDRLIGKETVNVTVASGKVDDDFRQKERRRMSHQGLLFLKS